MRTSKTKKPKKSKTRSTTVITKSTDDKVTCRKCGHTYIPTFMFDFYPDGKDPKVGLCEKCMMTEVLAPKPLQGIPTGHNKSVCKFGQGSATCAFLVIQGGEGLITNSQG